MRQIHFLATLEEAQAEAFSNALMEAGALAASIEDADAGTPEERARFAEPHMPGEAQVAPDAPPAWSRNRVVMLAAEDADLAALISEAAAEAGMSVPEYRVETVTEQDWVSKVQSQFEPIRVGRRLWIVPSWHEPPADPDAIVLRIDPGRAFGTGGHPSTRLVLGWLEEALARGATELLDYGCGSGILAIAAGLLGVRQVDAVDLDPQAIEATRENARRNGTAIRVCLPEALPPGRYGIVVANILSQPLVLLAPLLGARVRPGGRLALSGILEDHAAEVIEAYAPEIALRVAARDEGWVLLEGTRRTAAD